MRLEKAQPVQILRHRSRRGQLILWLTSQRPAISPAEAGLFIGDFMFWMLLLIPGDVIDLPLLVKHSGDTYTWTASANPQRPGDRMEIWVTELVSGNVIATYSGPIDGGQVVFTDTISRVGVYDGHARACSEECSDWVRTSNLIFAILAPPGAPEF